MVGEIFVANHRGFSDVYSPMLIECTSCDAKYRVPDERVAGKTVRLRCKRCGTGIVVDASKDASVMFSLAMLTKEAPKPPAPTPVDDIAHISAGDVFAPLLTAPAPVEAERVPSRAGWIAAAAIGAVIAVALPVGVVMTRRPVVTREAVAVASASASASTVTVTSTIASTAPLGTTTAVASESLSAPPAPRARASIAVATTAVRASPPPPKCCPGETDAQCEIRRSVGAACAQESRPFDRGAAHRALAGVNLSSCNATGAGHVKVTFEPDGSASAADVDDGAFVGTPTAACIARSYRATKVPAFSGPALTVGKTFSM
jgi:predicted Zn finger-like uncharacterized protein